jgi:hypothetical protein
VTRPVGRPAHGRPGPGQGAAFELPTPAAAGAVAAAVELALVAADDAGRIEATDLALVALAIKVAGAVDLADARGETRAVVSAARELASLLSQLGLTTARQPAPREDRSDDVAAFLAGLGTPSLGDTAQP